MLLGYIFLAAGANTDIGEVFALLFFLLHMMNQRLSYDFGNASPFFIRQCFDVAEQCLVSINGSALHGDGLTSRPATRRRRGERRGGVVRGARVPGARPQLALP